MGFNFGAFAGGTAEGIQAGSTLRDQQLSRQLKQQQLQEYLNQQAGQRAFTNVAMPGANAMPGTPENPGSGWPTLAQLPVIAPVARGLQSAGNAFMDFFGGGQGGAPSGGGMPPVPARPASQSVAPSAPPAAVTAPTVAPTEGVPPGHPGLAGTPAIPGMQIVSVVATAIDKANPGLKTSNPQAFAQAVQLGVKQVQDYTNNQAEVGKRQAEITHLGAQTEAEKSKVPLNTAHAKLYEERSKYGPYGKSATEIANKDINTQITQTGVALRHYENLKSRALSAPVLTPELKAMAGEAQKYIDALQVQMSNLRKQQTDYTPPKPAPTEPTMPNISAGKQTLIAPIVDTMVSLGGDPAKTTRYVKQLQAGGMPQDEINWVLMSAKNRLANPSGKVIGRLPSPQNPEPNLSAMVPQGR